MVIVMVPRLSAFLFVSAFVLLVSRTASGEEPETPREPPAAKTTQSGQHAQSVQPGKHPGISPAQKTVIDRPTAKPGLKHSDYRIREKANDKNSALTRLARTTPETVLYDVDGMPVVTVGRQESIRRAPAENISATAWAWALIPIGMGLVLYPLRRNYRRSTIRP
jgi:hypothetical protein